MESDSVELREKKPETPEETTHLTTILADFDFHVSPNCAFCSWFN